MRTTQRVYARGKVTIPAQIRSELEIEDGDLIELEIRTIDAQEVSASDGSM
ncbi:AbrB/MazE/SpoVT family DNA-binding domain-containing protein [Saliphagus sp. GCM10025308]